MAYIIKIKKKYFLPILTIRKKIFNVGSQAHFTMVPKVTLHISRRVTGQSRVKDTRMRPRCESEGFVDKR